MRKGFWAGLLLLLMALGLSAGPATARQDGSYSPKIDTRLDQGASHRKVEPRPDGARRAVAVARYNGVTFAFVDDEVIVASHSRAEAQALAARWHGRVLKTLHWRQARGKVADLYLVRVDTSRPPAGVFNREDNRLAVSGERGLALLKIITTEHAQGRAVGLNLLTKPADILEGWTYEGGPPGGFHTNAATWDYMQKGGPLDVNVMDAWRALAWTGKLNNKVRAAIIDQGFGLAVDGFNEADWGGGAKLYRPNDDDTADDAFPWHGAHSADAFGGSADDQEGAAGPAGPIAGQMQLIPSGFTLWGLGEAYEEAMQSGAKIISMSLSIEFPQTGASSVLSSLAPLETFEDAMQSAYDGGDRLIFAAAGNSGTNVDTMDGDEEMVWWFPCENHGVICVNGWANSTDTGYGSNPHALSNYGQGKGDSVDISGPFTLFVGNSPDSPDPGTVRKVSGTSVSTPFVAGVAALVWAANPKLTSQEVWNILWSTAFQANPPVRRVKAYAAVQAAMQKAGNIGWPVVKILQPKPGDALSQTAQTQFSVTSFDPEDGDNCCTAVWSSPKDGAIGEVFTLNKAFPGAKTGEREVSVTVTDSGGKKTTAKVKVTLNNKAPTVVINKTPPGPVFVGVPQPFGGLVFDDTTLNGVPDLAACGKLQWTSLPSIVAPSCDVVLTFFKAGTYPVTASYVDAQGAKGSASVNVTVLPLPAGPSVSILNPTPLNAFGSTETIPVVFKIVQKLPAGAPKPQYQEIWTLTWVGHGQPRPVPIVETGPVQRSFSYAAVFPEAADALAIEHFILSFQVKDPGTGILSNPFVVEITQTATIH